MASKESIANCPSCTNEYESPRILPCLESICINCINNLSKRGEFKCYFCDETHAIPREGFPLNKSLMKISKTIRTGFDEKPIYVELRNNIKKVDELLDYFDFDLETAKTKIKESCDDLRSKINTNIDQQIKFLNDTRDDLMDEVYVYEKGCLKNLDSHPEDLKDMKQLIEESKSSIEEDKKTLSKLTESRAKDKLHRVLRVERSVKGQKRKFKHLLFKNTDLVYSALDLCDRPCLHKKNAKEIHFKDYKPVQMYKHFDIYRDEVYIKQLDNKNFVIQYYDEYSFLSIVEIRNFHKPESVYKCYNGNNSNNGDTIVSVFKNKIIILNKHSLFDMSMKLFDENLDLQLEKSVSRSFSHIVPTESKIFCFVPIERSIVVYDWNFNELRTIHKNSHLYNSEESVEQVCANDEYLLFLNYDKMSIVSINDGESVTSFSLKTKNDNEDEDDDSEGSQYNDYHSTLLGVSSDNVFVDERKTIDVYDFNGNLIESIQKIGFKTNRQYFFYG